jgi:hypothetical protein
MRKKIAAAFITLGLLIPAGASAQSLADLQAQIAALLAQLTALQAQVGNTTPAPVSTPTTTTTSTSGSCEAISNRIVLGIEDDDVNGDVTRLQNFLTLHAGYTGSISGHAGNLTITALKNWQASQGIVSSGTPESTGWGATGPTTRAKIAQICSGTQTPSVSVSPYSAPHVVVNDIQAYTRSDVQTTAKDAVLGVFAVTNNAGAPVRMATLGISPGSGTGISGYRYANVRIRIGSQEFGSHQALIVPGQSTAEVNAYGVGTYVVDGIGAAIFPAGSTTHVTIIADPDGIEGSALAEARNIHFQNTQTNAIVPTEGPQFRYTINFLPQVQGLVTLTPNHPAAQSISTGDLPVLFRLALKDNSAGTNIRGYTVRSIGTAPDSLFKGVSIGIGTFGHITSTGYLPQPVFDGNRTFKVYNSSTWGSSASILAGQTAYLEIRPNFGPDTEATNALLQAHAGKTVGFEVTEISLSTANDNVASGKMLSGAFPYKGPLHTITTSGTSASCTLFAPAKVNVGSQFSISWTAKNAVAMQSGGWLPTSSNAATQAGEFTETASYLPRIQTYTKLVKNAAGVESSCSTSVEVVASGGTVGNTAKVYLSGDIPTAIALGTPQATVARLVFDTSASAPSIPLRNFKLSYQGDLEHVGGNDRFRNCKVYAGGIQLQTTHINPDYTLNDISRVRLFSAILVGRGGAGTIDLRCDVSSNGAPGAFKATLVDINEPEAGTWGQVAMSVDGSGAPANASPIIQVRASNYLAVPDSVPAPSSGTGAVCYPSVVAPGGVVSGKFYGPVSPNPWKEQVSVVDSGAFLEYGTTNTRGTPSVQLLPPIRPVTVTFVAPEDAGNYKIQSGHGGNNQGCAFQVSAGATAASFDFTVAEPSHVLSINKGVVTEAQFNTSADPNRLDTQVSTTIWVSKTAGVAAPVTVTLSGVPAGIVATLGGPAATGGSVAANVFAPSSQGVTCSAARLANGLSCPVSISMRSSSAAVPGTYTITINANGSGVTRTKTFVLQIQASTMLYTLSGPSVSVVKGQSVTVPITVTKTQGDAAPVSVFRYGSNMPVGVSGTHNGTTFSQSSCTPNPTCMVNMTITTTSDTPTGSFNIRGPIGGDINQFYGQDMFQLTVTGSTAVSSGPTTATASTHAIDRRSQVGQTFTYSCPANLAAATIWGTDMYTDDSPICTAAVHKGIITRAAGGTVTIKIEPGQSTYTGSSKNGVGSGGYGSWPGSYSFVTTQASTQTLSQLASALQALLSLLNGR